MHLSITFEACGNMKFQQIRISKLIYDAIFAERTDARVAT